MTNPYKNIANYCFWSRAMMRPAPGHIDPVVKSERIHPGDKIATMGSCFAQHISRFLSALDYNFYIPESPPQDMPAKEAERLGFGVFSARYGNIYTVRQAVQLFDRAFGSFTPMEDAWRHGDKWVDPYRPTVFPDGFTTRQEMQAERVAHFKHVRAVFEHSDWLVFTLGLTEAWRSKADGAIFPVVPGAFGGEYDPSRHAFVNFSISEVISDLQSFVEKLLTINPKLKFIFTVSPVSLIATYEDRHVLVSNTCSKSILRVAVDEIEKQYKSVFYFPSYEVITSPATQGWYYRDDLRQVTDIGVAHVMRLLKEHFLSEKLPDTSANQNAPTFFPTIDDVLCDEELIEFALDLNNLR